MNFGYLINFDVPKFKYALQIENEIHNYMEFFENLQQLSFIWFFGIVKI